MKPRLLIVGNPNEVHLGAHLYNAAQKMGLDVSILDHTKAYAGPRLLRSLAWHLWNKRPLRLNQFSLELLNWCLEHRPDIVLTTGISPLNSRVFRHIKDTGCRIGNYLSDDPWNPAHHAHWFMKTLGEYDFIFTPRKANLDDLQRLSDSNISYLPFGYAPEIHYPLTDVVETTSYDMVFYGNVEEERVALLEAIVSSGIRLRLYSASRLSALLKKSFQGYASPARLRVVTSEAPLSLVIGRKANRDDNAMRSYEVPAMKGCIVAEDTPTHRELYGDGARYFKTVQELLPVARQILSSPLSERIKMRHISHETLLRGNHTYRDRLETMVKIMTQGHH